MKIVLIIPTILISNIANTAQQELLDLEKTPATERIKNVIIAAKIGDDVTIPCIINGDPTPIPTWYQVITLLIH